jgi:hypothetical protein
MASALQNGVPFASLSERDRIRGLLRPEFVAGSEHGTTLVHAFCGIDPALKFLRATNHLLRRT